jgi:pheromone shutdown protein TraB
MIKSISKSHLNLYKLTNKDWTTFAFQPFKYKGKNGICNLHFIGIHHDSIESLNRVEECLKRLKLDKIYIELPSNNDLIDTLRNNNDDNSNKNGTNDGTRNVSVDGTNDGTRDVSVDGTRDGTSIVYQSKKQSIYGKEFTTAIKLATQLNLEMLAIDEESRKIPFYINSKGNILKDSLVFFKLNPNRNTSNFGRLLYKLFYWWIFGKKDIIQSIQLDQIGIGELKDYLRIFSLFHPRQFFNDIQSRDMIMAYRIIMDLEKNSFNSVGIIVGKGHVFGIQELLKRFNNVLRKRH